ncbi:putative virion structural protein [Erwinia phage vB_EamM_Desertfox]|uniref:Putative virion structural protein n=6 Tax=Agricanvirus TaxID=1984776 RepID=A0A482IJF5_9CAUD|nr:putative virion structural protein [Erwinia phage vB_EamM_Deimos-Minion]YP_009621902.1 putative virion structural protein [Erwinia phage vB_EamM_Desertfox]AUG85949.1 putative virion structural protein [Erwinia phage vB_EamM_Bosolaphorus]AUG86590.1 putative virion structural protein [Erwinia phage vB_EamM_MadMel]AUG86914.1 putative virion structural protein [Erwinia phage vB_EamM_Mortimer]QBP07269.1 putative virion structural protein [Erwinia phage Rebecca]ANH52264.1 putative virion structu
MLEMLFFGGKKLVGTGPGPATLLNYYNPSPGYETGYYGTIPPSQFIDTATLRSLTGFNNGTVYNSGVTWAKFVVDGKILFIPTATMINSCSWEQLYAKGMVYGIAGPGKYPYPATPLVPQNKTITFLGYKFLVRLPKCGLADPLAYPPNAIEKTSEWGRTMFHIASETTAAQTESGEKWASINLAVSSTLIQCQETQVNVTSNNIGPYSAVTKSGNTNKNYTASNMHWRPVLELIGSA